MPERLVRHGSAPYGTVELDVLDRRIIQLLRHDGRRSYADIARLVSVSEPTVRKRVDRLVQTGAIYVVARVNPAAIGFAIDAMVGIRVKRGSVQNVGSRLAAMDNVAYVGYMTGGFDIFIEVFLPDTRGSSPFSNTTSRPSRRSPTPRRGTCCAPRSSATHGRVRPFLRGPTPSHHRTSNHDPVPKRHPTRSVSDHEAAQKHLRNSTRHGLRACTFRT